MANFITSSENRQSLENKPLEAAFRKALRGTSSFVKEDGLNSDDKRHKALAEYLRNAYKSGNMNDEKGICYVSVAEQKSLHRDANPDRWTKSEKGHWVLKRDPKSIPAEKADTSLLKATILAEKQALLGRLLKVEEIAEITYLRKKSEMITMLTKIREQAAEKAEKEKEKAEQQTPAENTEEKN